MLTRYLWLCYDNLGSLFIQNFVWTLLNTPYWFLAYCVWSVGLQMGGAFAWGGALLGIKLAFMSPVTIMLYISCHSWVWGRDGELGPSIIGIRKYFWRAQILQMITLIFYAVLGINTFVYSQWSGWIGAALVGVMLWIFIFIEVCSLQLFPILVTQNIRTVQILKLGVLFMFLRPGYALKCICIFVGFLSVGFLSGLGVFLGLFAAWILWMSTNFTSVLSEYKGEDWEPNDSRTFRDLLRPWEI